MYRIMVVHLPNLFLCECDDLSSEHLYGVGYR